MSYVIARVSISIMLAAASRSEEVMRKSARRASRSVRLSLHDEEQETNPSYFEWREQTVKTVVRSQQPKITEPNALVRLFRRISRKD